MKAFVVAAGLLTLLSACSPQTSSNIETVDSSAIINGKVVPSSDPIVKSVASIQNLSKNAPLHRCSSVLITSRVLLTAAHCLYDAAYIDGKPRMITRQLSEMGVAFGANVRNSRRIIPISRTVSYPGYNPMAYFCRKGSYIGEKPAFCTGMNFDENSSKDIAIVFLADDAPAGTQPAKLHHEGVESLNTVYAGYGLTRDQSNFKTLEETRPYTGILHSVRVKTAANLSFSNPTPNAFIFPRHGMYAIRYESADLYADNSLVASLNGGDSGGPLFAIDEYNELRVVGVLSFSKFYTLASVRSYAHTFIQAKPKLRWLESQLRTQLRD